MVRRMLSPRMPSVDLAESGTPSLTDSAVIKYRRNIVSGSDMLDFEIGVYAVNEALVLGDCLRSVDQAYAGYRAGITVILNGTRANSVGVVSSLRLQNADLRVLCCLLRGQVERDQHVLRRRPPSGQCLHSGRRIFENLPRFSRCFAQCVVSVCKDRLPVHRPFDRSGHAANPRRRKMYWAVPCRTPLVHRSVCRCRDQTAPSDLLGWRRARLHGGGMGLDSVLIRVGFLVAMRCFYSSPIWAPQRDSSRRGSSGYWRIRLQLRKPLPPSPDADRSARCRSGRPGRASVRAALPVIPHHRVLPRVEEMSA
jgi:hypothetical protein